MFEYFFYTQFLVITILQFYLIIRGVVSPSKTRPKELYTPLLSSVACAGIIALALQAFTWFNPRGAFKATFYLSPIFTCAYGVLLICIGTPGSSAASVFALAFSVFISLYACWVSPRFHHATRILAVSITQNPPKINTVIPLSISICTLYSAFLMSGIGGATMVRKQLNILFISLSLGSFTWTLHIARNMINVTISHIKYMKFASGTELELKTTVKNSAKYSMGSVCIGSILVPVLGLIRGLARAISLVSGDVDEFMFSCANCCSGVGNSIIGYGNRWGFVQVGVYKKGIVQGSMDTWEMFRRIGIEKLINADLTSSFCFLCGISAGSICALIGGSWALIIHRTYATEVSLYAFLTGYLLVSN